MPPKKKSKTARNIPGDVDKTLTPLAKLHGHPPKYDKRRSRVDKLPDPIILTIFPQLKSGLTPISSENPQTQAERKNIQEQGISGIAFVVSRYDFIYDLIMYW